MSHKPTNKAAVDEGRDPYGLPGRGNGYDLWLRLGKVPCVVCGATRKSASIEGDRATVRCHHAIPDTDEPHGD